MGMPDSSPRIPTNGDAAAGRARHSRIRPKEGEKMKAIPELERDWAMRRLELFNVLDGSVQQTIRTVLDVAAQVTREAEEVASRLRHDTEIESARMRKEAEEERERILGDMR